MTPADRKIMTLAAKAAGKTRAEWDYDWLQANGHEIARDVLWNPPENSGQALELAVLHHIDIEHSHPLDQSPWVAAHRDNGPAGLIHELVDFDDESMRLEATCRAITRAVAAIGATMP